MITLRIKTFRDYLYARQQRITEKKLKNGAPFKDSELIYASRSRCPCGAGIAYPKGMSVNGFWDCSDILKGLVVQGAKPKPSENGPTKEGWDGKHTDRLPFSFYDLKSELQPSAKGATTRP